MLLYNQLYLYEYVPLIVTIFSGVAFLDNMSICCSTVWKAAKFFSQVAVWFYQQCMNSSFSTFPNITYYFIFIIAMLVLWCSSALSSFIFPWWLLIFCFLHMIIDQLWIFFWEINHSFFIFIFLPNFQYFGLLLLLQEFSLLLNKINLWEKMIYEHLISPYQFLYDFLWSINILSFTKHNNLALCVLCFWCHI